MGIIDRFFKKQKAKATYGVVLAQLTILEDDLLCDRYGKVDIKYWEEGIKELEWIKNYIQEANADLEHFKTMYELYLKKNNIMKKQGE